MRDIQGTEEANYIKLLTQTESVCTSKWVIRKLKSLPITPGQELEWNSCLLNNEINLCELKTDKWDSFDFAMTCCPDALEAFA